ncbi:MAG: hypothetical protein ACTSV7_09515 [Candidatus Baldrarchaeia archaeon]
MMYVGHSTLRVTPPLCLTREEADKALEIIDCAMRNVELGKASDKNKKVFQLAVNCILLNLSKSSEIMLNVKKGSFLLNITKDYYSIKKRCRK